MNDRPKPIARSDHLVAFERIKTHLIPGKLYIYAGPMDKGRTLMFVGFSEKLVKVNAPVGKDWYTWGMSFLSLNGDVYNYTFNPNIDTLDRWKRRL